MELTSASPHEGIEVIRPELEGLYAKLSQECLELETKLLERVQKRDTVGALLGLPSGGPKSSDSSYGAREHPDSVSGWVLDWLNTPRRFTVAGLLAAVRDHFPDATEKTVRNVIGTARQAGKVEYEGRSTYRTTVTGIVPMALLEEEGAPSRAARQNRVTQSHPGAVREFTETYLSQHREIVASEFAQAMRAALPADLDRNAPYNALFFAVRRGQAQRTAKGRYLSLLAQRRDGGSEHVSDEEVFSGISNNGDTEQAVRSSHAVVSPLFPE